MDARTLMPVARRKRAAGWLTPVIVILVVVLLLVGYGGQHHPRSYRVIGRYPMTDDLLLPCVTGFLIHEQQTHYVYRDWHGKVRWRVTTAAPRADGKPITGGFGWWEVIPAVSPHGHYFAAAVADWPRVRVQIWQDGRLRGEHIITPDLTRAELRGDAGQLALGVQALDSGRVFVWHRTKPNRPILALEGAKIVGRGMTPPFLRAPSPDEISYISPDGASFITVAGSSSFRLGTLAVANGKVTITPGLRSTASLSLQPDTMYYAASNFSLFAKGAVLSEDGAVYRKMKRVNPPTGWTIDTIAPLGTYTLQYRDGRSRVFSPITGDAWEYRVRGENHGGDATADGRYALNWTEDDPSVASIRVLGLVRSIPGINRIAPLEEPTRWNRVSLYERPGRLRAQLRMEGVGITDRDAYYSLTSWYPTGDGGGIVMGTQSGEDEARCFLLRWCK